MQRKFKRTTLAAAAVLAFGAGSYAHAVPVALELALLVDVSGSVSTSEYAMQKQGYVDAFNSASIQTSIAGLTGGIAVTYIEWSSSTQQSQLVGWSHLTDATSSSAFASAIAGTSRAFTGGGTNPDAAINFAAPLFTSNDFEGQRWVIDVSGDGTGSSNTSAARDAFLNSAPDDVAAAINGLCIGGTSICNWYQANIQGGSGSFVVQAETFEDFGNAVRDKLGREIPPPSSVPVPGTAALLGLGMLAVGAMRRRRPD